MTSRTETVDVTDIVRRWEPRAKVTAKDMVRTMEQYVDLKRDRLVAHGMHFWDAERQAAQDVLGVVVEAVSATRWQRLRMRLGRPVFIYRDPEFSDHVSTFLTRAMVRRMSSGHDIWRSPDAGSQRPE